MSSPPSPLTAALERLSHGHHLTPDETDAAFGEVMAGEATPAAIAALLLGLRAKGETADELAGAARALRRSMRRVDLGECDPLVDTCGTGGGTVRTLNLSTAAALVVAGAGVGVAKHGNRSFTSRSGSADVLEALGVAVDHPPEVAPDIFRRAGVVFLFAPVFHPAMRHAAPVRKELGVTTVMNMLGPLANPAGVTRQVIGVSEPAHGPLMAHALRQLGAVRALVVHAAIGLDEIAPLGETMTWEAYDGSVVEDRIHPADLGMESADLRGTEGGEPAENAQAINLLLGNPDSAPTALRNAVVLNAAAALMVSGLAADLREGVARARESLERGDALERLERLRRATPR